MSAYIINPGSGPAHGATEDEAEANIQAFIEALGFPCDYERDHARDYGNGRFAYWLKANNVRLAIQMPGIALDRVTGDILCAPRLYVDGNSWWWSFALDIATSAIWREDDDE